MVDPLDMEAMDGPEAQALAMARLLRGEQQEDDGTRRRLAQQRAFGNLGVLSGDSVLTRLGQGLIQQAQDRAPLDLRAASLRQGGARLALQAESEGRKAQQGAKSLALKEELGRGGLAVQRARLGQAREAAQQAKTGKALDEETGLRKEFNALPEVKEFSGLASSYANLLSSAKDMSGPGGVATIFNFMKMLDPGVAVMEGDVQLIRNSGGKAAAFANLYEQALRGNSIPESVRKDLLRQATTIYGTRKQQVDKLQQQYTGIAERVGAAPERVIIQRAPDINLDAPASPGPAGGAMPRVVSVKGMKRGDLLKSLRDGEAVRVPMGGGKFQTVRRKGGTLVKVKE